MITQKLEEFIKTKTGQLEGSGIDISSLELDHFGYQTSSKDDYEMLKLEAGKIGELKKEASVGGRSVAIYKLTDPVKYQNFSITAFELIEPKPGQVCNSTLDHIEFILTGSFQSFLDKYPEIEFDTSAIDRDEFPKVMYNFEDGTSIRFHLRSILEEVK